MNVGGRIYGKVEGDGHSHQPKWASWEPTQGTAVVLRRIKVRKVHVHTRKPVRKRIAGQLCYMCASLSRTCVYTPAHKHSVDSTCTPLYSFAFTLAQVTNPIEPLMLSLVRGYVDDEDLNSKLRALYQVLGMGQRLL